MKKSAILFAFLFTCLVFSGGARISAKEMPKPYVIHDMVKTSLLAFNKSVKVKDFTYFHSTLATLFKEKYTPEDLKEAFKEFIEKEIDFSSIKDKPYYLTVEPYFNEYDNLQIEGFFLLGNDTEPNVVIFKLIYHFEDNQWKLTVISVNAKTYSSLPSYEEMVMMIQKNLLYFNSAVKSKNFTFFHSTLAKAFADEYTPEKLKEVFHEFWEKGINFETISGKIPRFTQAPEIDENNWLILEGEYKLESTENKSVPTLVHYIVKFVQEDGEWKLIGINVRTE